MIILFLLLNFIVYLFLSFYKIQYISKTFFKQAGIINPFVIFFLAQFPFDLLKLYIGPFFILENFFSNKYYNTALFINNIGIFSDTILFLISIRLSKKYNIKLNIFNFKTLTQRMIFASILFYFLFLIFFLFLSSHSFGVINWIKSPREGYQLHRTGAGQFWVFAISCLSISYTLTLYYVKSYRKILVLVLIYLYSAYLLGSKGIILDYFTFLFVILWLKKYRHLKSVFVLVMPILILFLLYIFFKSLTFSISDLSEVFTYFDHFVNSSYYFELYYNNDINLYYGKIFYTNFWSLIPRGIYPDKPYVYGINYINEIFWPGQAELTNTPAFGGPIAYFADFGIIGVVLMTILNPISFFSYYFLGQLLKNYNYKNIKDNGMLISLFILFTSPFFLFSLSFPLNIIFFIIIVVLINFLNRIKLYSN